MTIDTHALMIQVLETELSELSKCETEDADLIIGEDRAHFARRRARLDRLLALVKSNPAATQARGFHTLTAIPMQAQGFVMFDHVGGDQALVGFFPGFYDADMLAATSPDLKLVPAVLMPDGVIIPQNDEDADAFEVLAMCAEAQRRSEREKSAS